MPEFAESKIQRADSNLETVESEVHYFCSIIMLCAVSLLLYILQYLIRGGEGLTALKKTTTKQNKVKTVDDRLLNYFSG